MSTAFLPSLLAYSTFLPSILVPLTGLVFPALTFAFFFLYIEREDAIQSDNK
ncbi:photosystem I reaction center subunit VIII [Nostoc sp. T09]|uniref:photosystem I reaction center subunit VIII n=1 Tax=Nostoc sp. T09 TaxID=1932621 RepID=UPI000A383387|nr:photosystem I reaction center subunit VIII [Nostoc sp. T09]OUL24092.1 photosystem I reaction center subunit VIII [Nostoc sp. T09]